MQRTGETALRRQASLFEGSELRRLAALIPPRTDNAADRLVLVLAQLRRIDRSAPEALAHLEQEFQTQETANVIRPKRRRRPDTRLLPMNGCGHRTSHQSCQARQA
jgi:hypothetical protein